MHSNEGFKQHLVLPLGDETLVDAQVDLIDPASPHPGSRHSRFEVQPFDDIEFLLQQFLADLPLPVAKTDHYVFAHGEYYII